MGKGLLILLAVFSVIALLNYSSLKLMKLEGVKKAKFKKVFFYFYGRKKRQILRKKSQKMRLTKDKNLKNDKNFKNRE